MKGRVWKAVCTKWGFPASSRELLSATKILLCPPSPTISPFLIQFLKCYVKIKGKRRWPALLELFRKDKHMLSLMPGCPGLPHRALNWPCGGRASCFLQPMYPPLTGLALVSIPCIPQQSVLPQLIHFILTHRDSRID